MPPTPCEDETAEPQSKPQWPAPYIFQTDTPSPPAPEPHVDEPAVAALPLLTSEK